MHLLPERTKTVMNCCVLNIDNVIVHIVSPEINYTVVQTMQYMWLLLFHYLSQLSSF